MDPYKMIDMKIKIRNENVYQTKKIIKIFKCPIKVLKIASVYNNDSFY